MGRLIVCLAFYYADPVRPQTRFLSGSCCTPPTLLCVSTVYRNVLAPWISGRKNTRTHLPLVEFLARCCPTIAFALKISIAVGNFDEDELAASPEYLPSSESRTLARKSYLNTLELRLIALVRDLVKVCFQLSELEIESRGSGSIFGESGGGTRNRAALVEELCRCDSYGGAGHVHELQDAVLSGTSSNALLFILWITDQQVVFAFFWRFRFI
jgi:hypothetical protein